MPHFISVPTAVRMLPTANRILVVGCSGSGKTTLALRAGDLLDLPYLSLDRDVRWLPGWQQRSRKDQRAIITDLVARDRWIMDGSNPSTFDLRVPRADLVVWVRLPRWQSLAGLARRVASNFGRVRVAMATGCPEPIPDRAFLSYIWNFERDSAPRFVQGFDRYGPNVPVVTLTSRRCISSLLSGARDCVDQMAPATP